MRMNGTRSPAPTVNRATVLSPSPWVGTGVISRSTSGPPTASMPPSIARTHGTIAPYPKRISNSIRIGTRPRWPATMRTTSVPWPKMGIRSINVTAPSAVSSSVSRISVPG